MSFGLVPSPALVIQSHKKAGNINTIISFATTLATFSSGIAQHGTQPRRHPPNRRTTTTSHRYHHHQRRHRTSKKVPQRHRPRQGRETVNPPLFPHPPSKLTPHRSCRSCTSFAAWASQTKKSTTTAAPKPVVTVPNDCPPDVETLGRSGWTLLHSIAATYPTQPTPAEQSDVQSFMHLFARLYPCWTCGEHFTRYMAPGHKPVRTGSRDELGTWLCEAHNEVNKKLGKEVFDCARWEERWRTGWKDGRCD